jgi:hypothetical protein
MRRGLSSGKRRVAGDVLVASAELDLCFWMAAEATVGPTNFDESGRLSHLPTDSRTATNGPIDLGLSRGKGWGNIESKELPLLAPVPRRVNPDSERSGD